MFTHLHLSDSELNKKLENLEEEQRQINIIEEEKARQQLREHQRLQELEVEEPLEESSIDFYGIDPKKSEQLASSIKTAFEKQTLNTWRKTLKSPLYPLTGIDHNRVNGRILYRYRTNKERAKYIDDHSIDTGEYRFEHHPFEKVIGLWVGF